MQALRLHISCTSMYVAITYSLQMLLVRTRTICNVPSLVQCIVYVYDDLNPVIDACGTFNERFHHQNHFHQRTVCTYRSIIFVYNMYVHNYVCVGVHVHIYM